MQPLYKENVKVSMNRKKEKLYLWTQKHLGIERKPTLKLWLSENNIFNTSLMLFHRHEINSLRQCCVSLSKWNLVAIKVGKPVRNSDITVSLCYWRSFLNLIIWFQVRQVLRSNMLNINLNTVSCIWSVSSLEHRVVLPHSVHISGPKDCETTS